MTLHVVHVAQPTTEGVPRCVVALVRDQVSAGLEVTVVSPTDGWLAPEARAAGARHVAWTARRSPGPAVVGETFRLRRTLRGLAPDLIHLHSAKAGLAGRLALRGAVPTVFQPHAWSFLAVRGALRAATLAWERFAIRWTTRVVCVSTAEYEDGARAGLELGQARVVPNGVDLDRYRPRPRDEARRRLGLGEGALAVCVGRLSEQKGQDVLLRAWPAVRARVPTARLALVGDGPWRERLRAVADDHVLFAGNSADPRDWYASSDVVVVPSRWEGMALVPLEAGASARSVVITDVPGARDAVPPGAGEVVPIGDAAPLSTAVARRLASPRLAASEGERARLQVERHFSVALTGDRMRAVYAEALGIASVP